LATEGRRTWRLHPLIARRVGAGGQAPHRLASEAELTRDLPQIHALRM
jgi:hypothetical protein